MDLQQLASDASLQDVVAAMDDEVLRGLSEEDLARLVAILQGQGDANRSRSEARLKAAGHVEQTVSASYGHIPPRIGTRSVIVLCVIGILIVATLSAVLLEAGDPCSNRDGFHHNSGFRDRYEALLREREAVAHEKEVAIRERDAISDELRTANAERERAQADAATAWEEVSLLRSRLLGEADEPQGGLAEPQPDKEGGRPGREASSSRQKLPNIGQQLHIGQIGGSSSKPSSRQHATVSGSADRDCEPLLSAYRSQSEQLHRLQESLERLREAYESASPDSACKAGGNGPSPEAAREQQRLEADLKQCREKWQNAMEVQERVRRALANDPKRLYGGGATGG